MKTMSKIFALLMALTMVLSLSVPVFAATQTETVGGGTGSLTISNATKEETYTIYKIFDATVSSDGKNVVYKIPAAKMTPYTWDDTKDAAENNTLRARQWIGDGASWFDVNANGEITAKESFTANKLKEESFKTWVKSFGTNMKSVEATENELKFSELPFGYYLVESSLGAVVSVDSTTPNVTLIDKNQEPSWDNGDDKPGKVIVEDKKTCGIAEEHTHTDACYNLDADPDKTTPTCGKVEHIHTPAGGTCYHTKVNEANLDEAIKFDIGINAKNYNGEHKIYHYIVDDDIAPGMSYIFTDAAPIKIDGLVVKAGNTVIPLYDATNAPNGYTITYYEDAARTTPISTSDSTKFPSKVQGFRISVPWTDTTKLCTEHDGTTTAHTDDCIDKLYECPHLYDNAVELHVTYSGKLDSEKADKVDYVNANLNKSTFNWFQDNDNTEPGGDDPNHEQPERQTETFDTFLELFKYVKNGQNKNALQGAQFTLTRSGEKFPIYTTGTRFVEDAAGNYWLLKDGTYTTTDPATEGIDDDLYAKDGKKYKLETFTEVMKEDSTNATTVSAYVKEDGTIQFKGLGEGTYTISETVVPAGYTKAEDITFTVTFNTTTKKFSSDNSNVTMGQHFTVEVENKSGSELPSTGGFGTTLFYLFGAAMTVGAGVVLVTRRRMKSMNA